MWLHEKRNLSKIPKVKEKRLRMHLVKARGEAPSRITCGLDTLDVDTLKSYTVLGLRGRCKAIAWCRRSSDQSLLSLRRSQHDVT